MRGEIKFKLEYLPKFFAGGKNYDTPFTAGIPRISNVLRRIILYAYSNIRKETRQIQQGSTNTTSAGNNYPLELSFSFSARQVFSFARNQARYLGQPLVHPEHILLGIVQLKEAAAVKILEELGANLSFLRRQVMLLIARNACLQQQAPALLETVTRGLKELIKQGEESACALSELARRSNLPFPNLPDRKTIIQRVLVGYLPEFLTAQIALQRYLLQETLKELSSRTGPLGQEIIATIISSTAQHLRKEVRRAMEQILSQEYRLFHQMPDEAEHEMIGSVIEDLWWAQSEEIALYDLFDEALIDHRRQHVLSLQKRRIEITRRIYKLSACLSETIHHCFIKHSLPS